MIKYRNMTTINWIFLSIIFISLLLYLIALIKKNSLMAKISSAFTIPFIALLNLSLLYNYLPDSRHIILTTIIAMSLVTISQILFLFENNIHARIAGRIAFILSTCVWMEIYRATYYIYRLPVWFLTLALIIYAGIITWVLILSGKQKFYKDFIFIIGLLIASGMHYSTLAAFCMSPSLSSILLTLGTTLTLVFIIIYFLDFAKYHFKFRKPLLFFILIASQSLIMFSNLLLIKS